MTRTAAGIDPREYVGVVLGTPYGLLRVTKYGGIDRHGKHQFEVQCLRCGWFAVRSAWNVLNHRGGNKPTSWCGPCRWEHEHPGEDARRDPRHIKPIHY